MLEFYLDQESEIYQRSMFTLFDMIGLVGGIYTVFNILSSYPKTPSLYIWLEKFIYKTNNKNYAIICKGSMLNYFNLLIWRTQKEVKINRSRSEKSNTMWTVGGHLGNNNKTNICSNKEESWWTHPDKMQSLS